MQIAQLSKSYHNATVLNNINLNITQGEVCVLLGSSGSGKSTLLQCINLLQKPCKGQMHFDGQTIDTQHISQKQWTALKTQIGMVFQQFHLWPHLTVIENLTLAPKKVLKIHKTKANKQAKKLLHSFKLLDKASAYPNQLSGGQQQRVAICRALMMQPKLLLWDEPTSALDPQSVSDVSNMIAQLTEQGMTQVVATHDIGFAKSIADKVAYLHQGNILEYGDSKRFDHPQIPAFKSFLNAVLT